MFIIEYIDFLGEIKNDTDINGKSFIFKIIDIKKEIAFESVLFIHQNIPAFITLENDDYLEYITMILEQILKEYNIKDLLEFKYTENNED